MRNSVYIILIYLVMPIVVKAASIEVVIDNIQPNQGVVRAGLFSDQATFPKELESSESQVFSPKETTVQVLFEGLEIRETYAVAVFQDLNENNKLEKNVFGSPTEPYGFSRPGPRFRPPTFEEVGITLTAEKTVVHIRLR